MTRTPQRAVARLTEWFSTQSAQRLDPEVRARLGAPLHPRLPAAVTRVRTAGAALALVVLSTAGATWGEPQDTPAGTVEALLQRVSAGEFVAACELLDPQVVAQYQRWGKSCETSLADRYAKARQQGHDVPQLDASLVVEHGDTATVPGAALTVDGKAFAGELHLVRRDGRWFLAAS